MRRARRPPPASEASRLGGDRSGRLLVLGAKGPTGHRVVRRGRRSWSPVDRWLGLGRATHRVRVERDVAVTMPDGARLLATRFVPRGVERGPVVLIRTPYGRDGRVWNRLLPRPLAARGYQVLVQSVRGTFGSDGTFEPGRSETADGLATVAWLRRQPWCDGRVVTTGGSYLATTQWALGPHLEEPLSALSLSIGSSSMLGGWYPQGAFGLDQTLRWSSLIAHQESRLGGLAVLTQRRRLARALATPGLADADRRGIGRPSPIYQAVLAHTDDPQHWAGAVDHSAHRAGLRAPSSMVTGWYDLFLRDQLRDHQALVAAGQESRITVGPWSHSSSELVPVQTRDTLELLDHVVHDQPYTSPAPVRLFVQGIDQWHDYPAWPPPARPCSLHLDLHGNVAREPRAGAPEGTRSVAYDPADPTPAVGGPTLDPPAGPQDQRRVEARPDVLVHTSDPLEDDLVVIGTTTAELTVSTPDPHALVVVRVCDVDPTGTSRNITEGLALLQPGGAATVHVQLDPTAHVIRRGHRIRVHLAAGAHPRAVEPHDTSYTVHISYTAGGPPRVTLPLVSGTGHPLQVQRRRRAAAPASAAR